MSSESARARETSLSRASRDETTAGRRARRSLLKREREREQDALFGRESERERERTGRGARRHRFCSAAARRSSRRASRPRSAGKAQAAARIWICIFFEGRERALVQARRERARASREERGQSQKTALFSLMTRNGKGLASRKARARLGLLRDSGRLERRAQRRRRRRRRRSGGSARASRGRW